MNIAYCSPFNPIKSGISDFSEELVMELKKYVNIDLFYNRKPSNKEIIQNFKYYDIKELYNDNIRSKYDAIVYHMGNNVEFHKCIAECFLQFPGILELHDFSLHNYLAGETFVKNDIENYVKCVEYCHGSKGVEIVQNFLNGKTRAPWETHALELTVNKHLIDCAKGVIVHSDIAKQMVKGIRPNVPVINIPLHTKNFEHNYEETRLNAKNKLNIDKNTLVIGSFGYATRAKRIIETLEALARYKKEISKNLHYFIVGKVDGINIECKINELSLKDNVTVTGFTNLEDFQTYMMACDICLNLRYPTHGESSASLHRMFGMGKAVIVTNIGSFDEYPDDVVLKVRYDNNEISDIFNAICEIALNKSKLIEREKLALEYAKVNCDLKKNANKYIKFFEQFSNNSYNDDDILDSFLDMLFDLNLVDNEYIEHLFKDKFLDILFKSN